MLGHKMNLVIKEAVHAFAQNDIRHGRVPDYNDYFACVRIAICIHWIIQIIKEKRQQDD